jgi:hypothetical protein
MQQRDRGARWRPISLAVLVASLGGCNAVLGIEPLLAADAGPDAARAGSGGNDHSAAGSGDGQTSRAGKGGRESTSTAAGSGDEEPSGGSGDEPQAGSGGEAHASGGAGGKSAGGTGGHASPDAGSGGSAGAGGAGDDGGAVHGRLIDYRRRPLPNITVRIGDKSAQTDSDGHFTIDAAPVTYDAVLTIATTIQNSAARLGWLFQGLTRRDPTLQVYRGTPDRTATTLITINNVSFPLSSQQRIQMTWASPDGSFSTDLDAMTTNYLSPSWSGPNSSAGTAHAVLFNVSSNPELPTSYTAHSAQPFTLTDPGTDLPVMFDLSAEQLTTGSVAGSVTGQSNNRENRVYLRFADNSALELISTTPSAATFSYLVPNIPDATFTVVAEDENNGMNQGFTAAYADNVTAGQTGIALTLPEIPVLDAPGNGKQNVDGTTLFQWEGSAKVFLLCANSNDNYDVACVLTSKKQSKLPFAPVTDLTPAANSNYSWAVEVHGDFASVDDAAGGDGYLSAYSSGAIDGPARGSGHFAISAFWGFKTAP